MRIAILHIALFFNALVSFSQELKTELSRPAIQIGEPVTLIFSIYSKTPVDSIAYLPKSSVFEAKNSGNNTEGAISTLYELEIMESFKDTSYQEGNDFIWKGKYTVTGWDSAFVVIPPERIILDDSVMYFPAALLEVGMPSADPSKPIRDINESFSAIPEESSLTEFIKGNWWWMAIILVVLVIIIWKLLPKRNSRDKKELSLRTQTLKEIDELEKSKSYESDLKEYYFDLSIIVRRFFSKHYAERMLDKTSSEIETLLATKGLNSSTIELVRKILNQSDLVKFAKSEPPISDVFVITNDARRVVNEIASLSLTNDDE